MFNLKNTFRLNKTFISFAARTIYTDSFFKIPLFIKEREKIESFKNYEKAKTNILENPGILNFNSYNDLKNVIFLTKTDEQFEFLLKILEKYKNNTEEIKNIGGLLIRLSYVLNKTNLMLEMFLKDETNVSHYCVNFPAILMQKLFNEKRFDDLAKVFYKSFMFKIPIENREYLLKRPICKIFAESLLKINSDDAVVELKNAISKMKQEKITVESFDTKAVACLFILAIQRNDYEFAFELSNMFHSPLKQNFILNLKIIALSLLNKPDEALNIAKKVPYVKVFFPDTLHCLKTSVDKSTNELTKKEYNFFCKSPIFNGPINSTKLIDFAESIVDQNLDTEKNSFINKKNRLNKTRRTEMNYD